MIIGHGGNIYELAKQLDCSPEEILDMSSNVNPLGPPSGLVACLSENLKFITVLPEVDSRTISSAFSGKYNLNSEHVLAGNGTTQFIYAIPKALSLKRVLILGPAYSDYEDACRMHQVNYEYLMAESSNDFTFDMDQLSRHIESFDAVFICNPNNPTGSLIQGKKLKALCHRHPDTVFIIDESYLPFVDQPDEYSLLNSGMNNIIILNSMSKIFRIPGLRIGFLIAPVNIVEKFKTYAMPWSVNSLAQTAVNYLMVQIEETESFIKRSVDYCKTERHFFYEQMKTSQQIKLFPSCTSFVLAELFAGLGADRVWGKLAGDKILIRNCANFKGLSDQYIRISLKTREENQLLVDSLKACMGGV